MAQFYVVASNALSDFAAQVARGLQARDWTVFDRSQVLPGDDAQATLDRELRAAGCVVVIVGEEHDVRSAAIAAIERRRLNPLVRVVPVVRQGIDLGQRFSSLNLLTRIDLTDLVDDLVDRLDDTGRRSRLRDDRVEVFGELGSGESRSIIYAVRAVTAGTFTQPESHAEAMYDPEVWARRPGEVITIRGPWEGFLL